VQFIDKTVENFALNPHSRMAVPHALTNAHLH